ncbi:uncharacterized protein LOC110987800 isoform X2 [Acanthaster planci]|uniref:Uncharacterized protein LOC110987800 isoform X2 n=1 Tax=Acanthaster planci TaxID=133434 RepID=A0A8B7ZNE7_ACAPL|nr:uncharacterized protein LOC110987800 isoform X2 [Acanthaster planci]
MAPMGTSRFTVFLTLAFCFLSQMCQGIRGIEHHIQRRSTNGMSCTCETPKTMLTCADQPTGCDRGEKLYRESCYRFIHEDLKSRDAAHKDCIVRKGHLVYIESEAEQAFLAFYGVFFSDSNIHRAGNHYWTGLIATRNYTWLDGSPYRRNLFTLEDDAPSGCIYVTGRRTRFYAGNCGLAMAYICEFPLLTIDVCQDASRAKTFGESCYLFFDIISKTFYEAKSVCEFLPGGHLLYIETQDELKFIEELLGKIDSFRRYWIGLMTQYVWLDGVLATYQAFVPNDYSHNHLGRCFRLYPDNDFRWNDFDCGMNYAYVCERELMAPKMQKLQGETCQPPVASLNYILQSGSLCIREVPNYGDEYFLCPCGKKDCIQGCGCATASDTREVKCICGLCSLKSLALIATERFANSSYNEWLVLNSTFLCKCSNGSSANTSKEVYQFKDGAFTSLNSTCLETPAAPGANTGVIVGVAITVFVILLITVAVVVVAYRKGGKKLFSERSNRAPKSTASSKDDRNRYDNDLVPSGAHRNPTFATSLDGPNPDDADYGYINPDTVQASQQPDTTKYPGNGESGNQSKENLTNQHPPKVTPYKPKPKTSNAGYVDVDSPPVAFNDETGLEYDPDVLISDEGYTRLARPFGPPLSGHQTAPQESGICEQDIRSDLEYQSLGPHDEGYNHLNFKK